MMITPMVAAAGGDWWLMIPLTIVLYFLLVLFFQILWNTTMPQVFDLKKITFWQAFRIFLIAGLLFGSGTWMKFTF